MLKLLANRFGHHDPTGLQKNRSLPNKLRSMTEKTTTQSCSNASVELIMLWSLRLSFDTQHGRLCQINSVLIFIE